MDGYTKMPVLFNVVTFLSHSLLLEQPVDSNVLAKFLGFLLLSNPYAVLIPEVTSYSIMGSLRVGTAFAIAKLLAMLVAFGLVATGLSALCPNA